MYISINLWDIYGSAMAGNKTNGFGVVKVCSARASVMYSLYSYNGSRPNNFSNSIIK